MSLYAVKTINNTDGYAFADPAGDIITAPDRKKYYTDARGARCRLYNSVVVSDPVILARCSHSGFVKIAWPAPVVDGPELCIDRTYTIYLDGHHYALGMDLFCSTVFSLEDNKHVSDVRTVADRNAAIRAICKPHTFDAAYNLARSNRCYGGSLYNGEN